MRRLSFDWVRLPPRNVFFFILFVGFSSCKDTDDGRYSFETVDGKKVRFVDGDDLVPPMPDGRLNGETLTGVDSDGDGVRDDVEIWINENGESTAIRISLKVIARNLLLSIVNYQNQSLAVEYTTRMGEGVSCLVDLYGLEYRQAIKVKNALYREIVNSRMREKAYLAMDQSLSGEAFGYDLGNACEVIGVSNEKDTLSN